MPILAGRVLAPVAAAASVLLMTGATPAGQRPLTTQDGVYSAAQARAGEALYMDSCAGCHARDLSGGETAPPLAGFEFNVRWNGRVLGELIRQAAHRMPQDAPGTLTRQASTDIVAFLLRSNAFPPGQADLPSRPGALKVITYEAEQP